MTCTCDFDQPCVDSESYERIPDPDCKHPDHQEEA